MQQKAPSDEGAVGGADWGREIVCLSLRHVVGARAARSPFAASGKARMARGSSSSPRDPLRWARVGTPKFGGHLPHQREAFYSMSFQPLATVKRL